MTGPLQPWPGSYGPRELVEGRAVELQATSADGSDRSVGTRLNNSFQRLNNLIGFGILTKFSQFFQNFLQLSANFDIFWRCSWNSDKISSRFRRKIPILMRFSWNLNWINYSTYSKMTKLWRLFCWNFEIWAVQKYENLVDLENPEKMSIWLLS